ncbi:Glutamate decarboxylase 2 [Coemansia sp. RSA 1822]|nr:Glutamate decarboxylase 2 [Coemansia sp. RSA 638]KAJ2121990.1 Glutamate decarboxylase 2 [Coemansia sp. RSA 720]KAJ2538557.1 Glutamate decarboxylase 2 [Coemansia sp. RSA 1853]KAJ2563147.1 Glutamate decarboxylase 2 [Coemansia sp. RSA 1822]
MDSDNAAVELRELLTEAARVFSEYVQQSQQPGAHVSGRIQGVIANAAQPESDASMFPDAGVGSRVWDDVRDVCAGAANTWSSTFLYKLYAAPAPMGVVAETLLAVLNNNAHVTRAAPSGAAIERMVARKLAQLLGFPSEADGLTFPGGSYANLHALMTARNTRFPDVRTRGMSNVRGAVFTSAHAHYSIDKAAVAAGFGLDSVVHVPTDAVGRMDVHQLRVLMLESKARGVEPFFVNATMGTTVLGACDPIAEISHVCREFGAWLHVDGSWGGPHALFGNDPALSVRGVHIDSFVVNPHKLLGVPLQCSFLIVCQGLSVMRRALGLGATYLFHDEQEKCRDSADLPCDVGDATLGCGRRPDAIKFWLMWRYYGTQYFTKRVAQARSTSLRLAELVRTRTSLLGRWVLVAEPASTCVCFWFVPLSLNEQRSEWGIATRRMCSHINDAGSMLIDYASVDVFDGNNVRALPEFFRIPINSPSVSNVTLDAVLHAIESAAAELYP